MKVALLMTLRDDMISIITAQVNSRNDGCSQKKPNGQDSNWTVGGNSEKNKSFHQGSEGVKLVVT